MSVFTVESPLKSHIKFEEAMALTGFGKFNYLTLLFCALMLFGMIMETLGLSYIIPACQCEFELSQLQKGWLSAIPFACIIITSHAYGYLADTRGRKKVLVYSMTLGSIFSIVSSFSPNLITFAILRIITGIFGAAPTALGYAYLGEMTPLKNRDAMVILGNASIILGSALVPLIAWGVLPADIHLDMAILPHTYRSWRLLIVIFALPYLFCSILFIFFPETPKFLHARKKSMEALKVLRKMYSLNTGNDPQCFPVDEIIYDGKYDPDEKKSLLREIWSQTVPLFRSSFLKFTFTTCFLQFVVFSVANGFYVWFPAILDKVLKNHNNTGVEDENLCTKYNYIDENNLNKTAACDDTLHTASFTITIILSLIICLAAVAVALSIKVCSKKVLLIMAYIITGTSSLSIYWVKNTMISIVLLSIPLFCSTCIGIISAFVIEIYPTNVRAMAVCITLTMGRVGSMFGTNLISYLLKADCSLNFFLFAGLLYGAGIVCFALPSKEKKT